MIQYKKHDFSQKHDFSFLKINYNIKQVTSVMKLKKKPQKTRMSSDTSVLALFTENDVVDLASIYKKFQVQRTEPIYHRCMFLHWSALIVLNTRLPAFLM